MASNTRWLHDWAESGESEMLSDFEIGPGSLIGLTVLLATYSYWDYQGEAFVLLRRDSDGALLRVDGGHCSCYGLEGQWEPEETTVAALRMALDGERFGCDPDHNFAPDLSAVLDEIEASTKEIARA